MSESNGIRRPELHRLTKPFPEKFVASKQGASYVNHGIVRQRILGTVGPFDIRIVDVIRGDFDEKQTGSSGNQKTWPARKGAVVGVVVECTFRIDGEPVVVQDVGTPEGYYMADHDGDRLKKAVSDGVKRCAMNVGVALDLWSKGSWFLTAMLEADRDDVEDQADEPDHDAPDPDDAETPAALAPDPEPEVDPEDEAEAEPEPDEGDAHPGFVAAVSEATVDDVKDNVRDGTWEPKAVLEVEEAHKARTTLVEWLYARLAEANAPPKDVPPSDGAPDWGAIAAEAGVPAGRLLLKARQMAEAAGVEPPSAVESIPDDVEGDLLAWVGDQ